MDGSLSTAGLNSTAHTEPEVGAALRSGLSADIRFQISYISTGAAVQHTTHNQHTHTHTPRKNALRSKRWEGKATHTHTQTIERIESEA